MTIHHKIKGDIFTLVIEGPFTAVEFFDTLENGMTDPAFKAPMRLLVDACKTEMDPSPPNAGDAPDRFYAQIGHCFIPRWAVVAASDPVLFGIARMICRYSDLRGVDMRPYEDVDEARCRLTWSNSHQQDPSCRMTEGACRPHFVRPFFKA